jgi:hypothetical protein
VQWIFSHQVLPFFTQCVPPTHHHHHPTPCLLLLPPLTFRT